MTMRMFLPASLAALVVGLPTIASAACLTDQEIEARIGGDRGLYGSDHSCC